MNKNTIPEDFDYKIYLKLNPDLIENSINTKELAIFHYLNFGIKEQRLYKIPKLIHENIDIQFDDVFYLNEYPDVESYYKDVPYISQKEKLFHHYVNYGKHEGRFKNKMEQDLSFVHNSFNISEYIKLNELVCPTNQLDCICLLTTQEEIKNQQYKKFINHLIKNTKQCNKTKNIDFKIIVNNLTSKKLNINNLTKIFRNVDIINLNLDTEDDIYFNKLPQHMSLPKYGLKSGPNITFFKTIPLCKSYNTTLLLETDCLLSENWLIKLYNYTNNVNGFLVSGAWYDGCVFAKSGSTMLTHINGGTALYATNHKVLQKLILVLSIFLQYQIEYNMPGLAYDYALKILIDNNLNNINNSYEDREIWKFINRNYLPCKAILNCSTGMDKNLDTRLLSTKYNYAILHKK